MSLSIRSLGGCAAPLLGSVACLLVFDAVGKPFHDFHLELGGDHVPAVGELIFATFWGVFGTIGALLLAISITRLGRLGALVERGLRLFPNTEDAPWIAFGSLAAFVIPFAIRMLALDDAAVADDEACYHFGAELVASGRLSVPSPPLKIFFDRTFMINDGRLYPLYFMGWPILLAPAVRLGVGGYMNAVCAAATAPALYFAAQRLAGSTTARATILFFLASPMLMIGSATEMSNPSCLMCLAWMFATTLRARDDQGSLLSHAGIGLFFGMAFLIRPPSALGIGAPLLALWGWTTVHGPRELLLRRLVAFAVPAAAMAVLFFTINKIQNGSYTLTGYAREIQYAKENGLRFNNWGAPGLREHVAQMAAPHIAFDVPLSKVLRVAGFAFTRLNYNLFGWVPSLLFAGLAVARREARILTAMVAVFFGVHYGVNAPGIDVYGPHHYYEVCLPLVIASALGVQSAVRWLRAREETPSRHLLPSAFAVALVAFTLARYAPLRIRALVEMGRDVNAAKVAVDTAGIHQAVVFSPRPFTATFAECNRGNARHFVYWRPNNDPDLRNDVLWVNHVTVEEDRKLMSYFPERIGVVMFFDDDCRLRLAPLAASSDEVVPPGDVDGTASTGIPAARIQRRAAELQKKKPASP